MRRALFCGALLGLVGAVACQSPSTAAHRAYVVVQHLSGSWLERQVNFTGSEIDGVAAMDRSGLQYQAQSVTSGKVVCQIDNEPATVSTCFPQNKPYWALFIESGKRWSAAPGGLSQVTLRDGQAIGWHYVRADDPSPTPPPMPREL